MSARKQVVLSEKNIRLLASLAEMVDGRAEVVKDPNFALSLLLSRMKEYPSHSVNGVLLDTLDPDMLGGARERAGRRKAA